MIVVDKTEKKIPFQTIPVGYTFYHNQKVYIVIDNRCTDGKNAVCLDNGLLYTFLRDAEVVPCFTKLEIIKKGSFA